MREIGSEFWDVPVSGKDNKLFPETTQWYISGRSALRSIISELEGCHTVAMPSWCCDSMVRPFVDAGFKIDFYPVCWQGDLVQCVSRDDDVLLLMNYFGYASNSLDLSNYSGIIIRDVTHSLFSGKYNDADYYFGSLRKWCGVWTGGYAWSSKDNILKTETLDDKGYISLREKAMHQKGEYIGGIGADKGYLTLFEQAEDLLDNMLIVPAADRDVMCARQLDVGFIVERRRANAEVLRNAFPDWLIFKQMTDTDCPMFVPVLVPNGKRDGLRKFLIDNLIYCPVHWPVSDNRLLDKQTGYIYANELSIVCDQRYTEEDMYRIVEMIRKYMED